MDSADQSPDQPPPIDPLLRGCEAAVYKIYSYRLRIRIASASDRRVRMGAMS